MPLAPPRRNDAGRAGAVSRGAGPQQPRRRASRADHLARPEVGSPSPTTWGRCSTRRASDITLAGDAQVRRRRRLRHRAGAHFAVRRARWRAQLAQILAHVPDGEIIELGPGSGRLAADILAAMAEQAKLPARYRLLEVSPELRERQRVHLAEKAPELRARIEWIDLLPERWQGAVIANELLDSVPPHLVLRRGDSWFERGVTVDASGRLAHDDRPLAAGTLLNAAQARFPAEGDYLSEINPAAEALVRTLALRCACGAMLLVDYGFPAAEYYHPQRSAGTLMAHYRHRAVADPFLLPGLPI